ncbi:MAG: 4-(cytidine 5'-diphospho)-2-C-methyl-D-erythritol kinase [Verrucomicrobiae bacterium]|nr:4-(cytidine 5'-diphospho)-2-C-methyl-D-erythritol kinase [Verrucomicrobiae bacterium]NNJ43749.1 4-(cytidine 5'-diphospho)-2-C-methyl-D-erythritol kinase [Akkermansiaceae bacterium]
MPQRTWIAPAKVNLTLRVLGKREDGFHELESLMAPLDLGDSLQFEKSDQYRLHCDTPGVPLDESNLITMAVRAFEKQYGRRCLWNVSLVKNVPHGAGLGGGSSDAASALLALNQLEQAGFTERELASMAAECGSDVPFFIYRGLGMIGGRGERVEPVDVPGLDRCPILLLKPSFGVSTPDAYQHCLTAKPLPRVPYHAQALPWGEIVNDLEKPVFQKHRFLAEIKMWLLAQPETEAAMMSGSGSTMMAFLSDKSQADGLLARARQELDPTLWGQCVHVSLPQ